MNKYAQRVQELNGAVLPFINGGQPFHVPDAELDNLERDLGHALPPDYREFVQDFGCFSFDTLIYPFQTPTPHYQEGTLGEFYGVLGCLLQGEHDLNYLNYMLRDVLNDYQHKVEREVLVPELLPIAEDACGNSVCLAFAGELIGSVYFWEANDATVPASYDNCHLIADSFDEFMSVLYRSP